MIWKSQWVHLYPRYWCTLSIDVWCYLHSGRSGGQKWVEHRNNQLCHFICSETYALWKKMLSAIKTFWGHIFVSPYSNTSEDQNIWNRRSDLIFKIWHTIRISVKPLQTKNKAVTSKDQNTGTCMNKCVSLQKYQLIRALK